MKRKGLIKIMAAALACTMLPINSEIIVRDKSSFTEAAAAETAGSEGVRLNSEEKTLLIGGYVTFSQLNDAMLSNSEKYDSIVAEAGTVFDMESAKNLFMNVNAKLIDLSRADTSRVRDMSYMFNKCSAGKLVLSAEKKGRSEVYNGKHI